eukprot:scaffold57103_cov35-Prasinocladus_malaysianus.AAC.2
MILGHIYYLTYFGVWPAHLRRSLAAASCTARARLTSPAASCNIPDVFVCSFYLSTAGQAISAGAGLHRGALRRAHDRRQVRATV